MKSSSSPDPTGPKRSHGSPLVQAKGPIDLIETARPSTTSGAKRAQCLALSSLARSREGRVRLRRIRSAMALDLVDRRRVRDLLRRIRDLLQIGRGQRLAGSSSGSSPAHPDHRRLYDVFPRGRSPRQTGTHHATQLGAHRRVIGFGVGSMARFHGQRTLRIGPRSCTFTEGLRSPRTPFLEGRPDCHGSRREGPPRARAGPESCSRTKR